MIPSLRRRRRASCCLQRTMSRLSTANERTLAPAAAAPKIGEAVDRAPWAMAQSVASPPIILRLTSSQVLRTSCVKSAQSSMRLKIFLASSR